VHVPLVVGLTAIAIWLTWVWRDGGFFATEWGILGALLLLVVALGLVWGAGRPRSVDARLVAFVALAGFVVWSYLSIAWAAFPGEALTGANKTLLYAASFVAFATFPWTPSHRVIALGAFTLGIAGIGAVWLTRVASSAEPSEYFVDGRLSGPVEYVNAGVAVWTLGALAAFHFASSRHLHVILRGLFLGVAVLLLQLALLGQSRAWLAALPATVFVYVLLSRDRPRLVLSFALASAAVLASLPVLLDVEPAASSQESLAAAVDRAALVAAVTSLGAACAGTVSALLDRRTRPGIRARRGLLVALGAVLILAAGVGAAAAARGVDDPGAWLSGRWDDFSAGDYPTEGERFGSLGSNRLEEWRVAWNEFEAHPVHGIGADNYAAAYLRQRDDDDYHPRYPHSTPLRHLSQLGLVGTALFAAFFGAAALLALRRRRDVDAVAGAVAATCLAAVSYWLLHGTADWLWEVPAVAAPAFGLLGLAGAPVWKGGDQGVRAGPGRLVAAMGSTVLLIALAALVFPWLAATYQASGIGVWRSNPDLAHVRLERAAELNPLSAEPLVADGAIGIRTGNFARAERAFIRARERESENWYVHFELGLIDGSRGRRTAALSSLATALALNPQEPAIRRAIRLVKAGRRPDPQRLGVFVLAGDRREATGR
jgi:O-Antigen ligase